MQPYPTQHLPASGRPITRTLAGVRLVQRFPSLSFLGPPAALADTVYTARKLNLGRHLVPSRAQWAFFSLVPTPHTTIRWFIDSRWSRQQPARLSEAEMAPHPCTVSLTRESDAATVRPGLHL
eukprot:1733511-Rhodomonas_salina.2